MSVDHNKAIKGQLLYIEVINTDCNPKAWLHK